MRGKRILIWCFNLKIYILYLFTCRNSILLSCLGLYFLKNFCLLICFYLTVEIKLLKFIWNKQQLIGMPFFLSNLQVVGRNRPVGLDDKGKMSYLEATLLEIQRMANTCKIWDKILHSLYSTKNHYLLRFRHFGIFHFSSPAPYYSVCLSLLT